MTDTPTPEQRLDKLEKIFEELTHRLEARFRELGRELAQLKRHRGDEGTG